MKQRIYVILFMIIVTAIATTIMTGAKVLLNDRIERNKTLAQKRFRLQAFGLLAKDASAKDVEDLHKKRVALANGTFDESPVYIAFSDDARTTILAKGFGFRANGLWGPFTGLIALDPKLEKIVGFVVTQHSETPGLGARMTEPEFIGTLIGKPATRPSEKGGMVLDFGPKATGPRRVNAISGATRTTEGLAEMFNRVLPNIQDEGRAKDTWNAVKPREERSGK